MRSATKGSPWNSKYHSNPPLIINHRSSNFTNSLLPLKATLDKFGAL